MSENLAYVLAQIVKGPRDESTITLPSGRVATLTLWAGHRRRWAAVYWLDGRTMWTITQEGREALAQSGGTS
jgi:hypothetical protein